jgi:predicted nucleic acid-binding protein
MGQEALLARLSVRARYQRDSLLPKRRWACRYCVAAGLAQNTPINISAITELELFAFANLSAREESLIEDLLATVSIITVDSRIARLAALARKSYGLKVPDSVIAATAMFTGSTLITRNTRDFRRVQNLAVLKI